LNKNQNSDFLRIHQYSIENIQSFEDRACAANNLTSRDFGNYLHDTARSIVPAWRGENTHPGALNFYPIFIPLFEAKVSGVSVQDMLFCLPFLTPET
jgi:hypothetical protein